MPGKSVHVGLADGYALLQCDVRMELQAALFTRVEADIVATLQRKE